MIDFMNKNILIIGGGQLGSRHLQALKFVKYSLNIFVVDQNVASLRMCKERYSAINNPQSTNHPIEYLNSIPEGVDYFLVIISTGAKNRANLIEELMSKCVVQNMVLEKILFQVDLDYFRTKQLLDNTNIKVFVNCSMRMVNFYKDLHKLFFGKKILYKVTGSNFNLISNLIHYLDHMAYLIGSTQFTLSSDYLDYPPIQSKRPEYLELTGIITSKFSNGSVGIFTSFSDGDLPVTIEIESENCRIISKESENKAYLSQKIDSWTWKESEIHIPFQSELTATMVNNLIEVGTCDLVQFNESMEIHLNMHKSLLAFLNQWSVSSIDEIPFT
jgi:hypothetical protein